jgi:non-heme chloroperoxidase
MVLLSTKATAAYRYVAGFGGAPLAVGEWGNPAAPGVLLIHGFGFSSAFWTPTLIDRLGRRFHVVAFDFRGHGASAKPWRSGDYAGSRPWADDVEAIVKATSIGRPVIIGRSAGGYVAEDFVREYGVTAVSGIVLVASSAGFIKHAGSSPPSPELAQILSEQYALELKTSMSAKEKLVSLMAARPLPPEVLKAWTAQEVQLPPPTSKPRRREFKWLI